MKRVLPILVALLLAAIASFGILKWARTMGRQGQTWTVVVAERALNAGDSLRKTDLGTMQVYAPVTQAAPQFWNFVFEDYVLPQNMGTLEGRVLNREVQPGFPIMRSMLKEIRKDRNIRDWKVDIEKGTRAISLPIDNVAAVSGLVQVGDYVDILVTLAVPKKGDGKERVVTMPVQMGQQSQQMRIPLRDSEDTTPMTFYLMQNVKLLAVGRNTQPPEVAMDQEEDVFEALTKQENMASAVTVAVSPEQAMLFAFATSMGQSKFMLALRRPGDTNIVDRENIRPADYQMMLQAVGAKQPE